MSKKLILSITAIIILFNALLPHYAHADNTASNTANTNTSANQTNTNTTKNPALNEGDKVKHEKGADIEKVTMSVPKGESESGGMASAITKILVKVALFIPYSMQALMAMVTNGDDSKTTMASLTDNNKIDATKSENWFTIEKAVYGKIPLFNIDFFDVNTENSVANSKIKQSVASWYQISFKLAQVISILILIYIGIRMAMASTAQAKAEYKAMLKNWLFAVGVLFLLHYGIVILIKVSNWLVSLIPTSLTEKGFEKQLLAKTIGGIDIYDSKVSVWSVMEYVISYWVIVMYEVYFFFKYFKRVVIMAFLIMITPLITITYPIDKIGDGKAQAYQAWKKLFLENVFIQPIDALMYAIFAFSASAIVLKAPLIAILFFAGILKGEEMAKKLFNLG